MVVCNEIEGFFGIEKGGKKWNIGGNRDKIGGNMHVLAGTWKFAEMGASLDERENLHQYIPWLPQTGIWNGGITGTTTDFIFHFWTNANSYVYVGIGSYNSKTKHQKIRVCRVNVGISTFNSNIIDSNDDNTWYISMQWRATNDISPVAIDHRS